MGATWAVAWALFGVGIGVSSLLLPGLPWDAFFQVFDAPLPALALPGFIGGCLFSVVLSIAERQTRFEQLSVTRFAGWGAMGGAFLSLIPAALVLSNNATVAEGGLGLWPFTGIVGLPLTLLSAASAASSLVLARRAEIGSENEAFPPASEEPRSNSVRNLL